jgi:hypothetical protein
MDNDVVAYYCLTDEMLQASGHQEPPQRSMTDAEVITTALVAARLFDGNFATARAFLESHGYILDKPREESVQSAPPPGRPAFSTHVSLVGSDSQAERGGGHLPDRQLSSEGLPPTSESLRPAFTGLRRVLSRIFGDTSPSSSGISSG